MMRGGALLFDVVEFWIPADFDDTHGSVSWPRTCSFVANLDSDLLMFLFSLRYRSHARAVDREISHLSSFSSPFCIPAPMLTLTLLSQRMHPHQHDFSAPCPQYQDPTPGML